MPSTGRPDAMATPAPWAGGTGCVAAATAATAPVASTATATGEAAEGLRSTAVAQPGPWATERAARSADVAVVIASPPRPSSGVPSSGSGAAGVAGGTGTRGGDDDSSGGRSSAAAAMETEPSTLPIALLPAGGEPRDVRPLASFGSAGGSCSNFLRISWMFLPRTRGSACTTSRVCPTAADKFATAAAAAAAVAAATPFAVCAAVVAATQAVGLEPGLVRSRNSLVLLSAAAAAGPLKAAGAASAIAAGEPAAEVPCPSSFPTAAAVVAPTATAAAAETWAPAASSTACNLRWNLSKSYSEASHGTAPHGKTSSSLGRGTCCVEGGEGSDNASATKRSR
mmetsp:Transcript_130349/g.325161  ORF Transcript_130349/g.325161 Transcript_130349/m.325161 type:complete len:340 (-) Transcript_130349:285-1304(-)